MFGAFSNAERKLLEDWISNLESDIQLPIDRKTYYNFTHLSPLSTLELRLLETPVKTSRDITQWPSRPRQAPSFLELESFLSLDFISSIPSSTPTKRVSRILALSFVSIGLLENMVTIPSRCSNQRKMYILQCLRALHGFDQSPEMNHEGVSGMDQVFTSKPSQFDLISVLCTKHSIKPIDSLIELDTWEIGTEDKEFLAFLLRVSWHHVRYEGYLIGLALGSAESLHSPELASTLGLQGKNLEELRSIQSRELTALNAVVDSLNEREQGEAERGRSCMRRLVAQIMDNSLICTL